MEALAKEEERGGGPEPSLRRSDSEDNGEPRLQCPGPLGFFGGRGVPVTSEEGDFEELPSLARDTGPRWSCRTYAPGPELELSYARATGPSGRCPARAPRAEVELSDAHQRPSLECS